MATVTPGITTPVATGSLFDTTPAYSGTFIPTLWSARMNVALYKASVFTDVTNTDWEGEISGLGDQVIINNVPTITISDYSIDNAALTYEVPVPSTQELVIDIAKAFSFQVNDVLAHQSRINLMDTFSEAAGQSMRVAVDARGLYEMLTQAVAAGIPNSGATAGVNSGNIDLGTDNTPVTLVVRNPTAGQATPMEMILRLGTVLDEQNVPDEGRFVIIDPATRLLLLQGDLGQAQITGDSTSILRNGRIGTIDRFKVYVSNNLPTGAAGFAWSSGDGAITGSAQTGAAARRSIIAGHTMGQTFASQITKVEPVRNPNNFGDYIRGLNVFGTKCVKPEAIAIGSVI